MISKPGFSAGSTTSTTPTTTTGTTTTTSLAHQEKWVTVTWMPHTTLAQTSHACLTVRSAHATLDRMVQPTLDDWRVRIGIYAIGGLLLVPLKSHTPAAPVVERSKVVQDNEPGKDQGESMSCFSPTVTKATHDCRWDAFLKLPLRWRDLPRDSYLLFEVVGDSGDVLYEATLPFFSEYGKLVTGLQKVELKVPPLDERVNHGVFPLRPVSKEHDENGDDNDNDNDDYDPVWEACCVLDQLDRMEDQARAPSKADSSISFGRMTSVPWLDTLMKERAKAIIAEALTLDEFPLVAEENQKAFLIVELPVFEIPVMHEEPFYSTPHGASGAIAPLDLAAFRKHQHSTSQPLSTGGTSNNGSSTSQQPSMMMSNNNTSFDPLQLVTFLDYEVEDENPVEEKYRTLAHDLLRGLVDPALKPDRGQRDRLVSIIESTSHHLSREEKDLLWRFRFSLVDNRRALTKFLLAVDWTVDSEVVQAAELLEQWRKRSPIEVTDALKLLGKHVAFQTNLVRSYAIDTLEAAPDSELRLYLLQLVQALKYENAEVLEPGTPGLVGSTNLVTAQVQQTSSLATFLINRASRNMELANFFYWYLKVELDNPSHGARYREVFESLKTKLSETPFVLTTGSQAASDDPVTSKSFKSIVDTVSSKIGTSFRSDHGTSDKEKSASKHGKARTMWDVLASQDVFISGLLDIQQQCRDARGKKDQKEEELRSMLAKEGYRSTSRGAVPLPSAPDIYVHGVNPETAKIFKSALYPALIDFHVDFSFKASHGHPSSDQVPSSYKVIVKTGDDLRQDQLVIMMIQLMDGLLKRAALDLCLTPYSILATSPTSGLVEFVEGSVPISQILSQYNGSILQFFQACAPQKGAKYDVRPDVMFTYLRSLAGYCVLTYLLGVGDRHLDNILLRSTGHFFHIDFGFIFGRDPKPLPPAFRLTREMVDGLGGVESSEYRQFCSLACQAFNALRKSAGLVLNLLHLMSDAGIEDLSNNPTGDPEAVIAKVEERFRLDLSDEQAERYFIGLINDCLAALAPRVMDVIHSFSVARR